MSISRIRFGIAGLALLIGAAGCGGRQEVEIMRPAAPDPSTFRPVKGTITIKGKPTAKIVVALFAANGTTSAGETDADGKYTIQTLGSDGAPPGEYKVALSYFLAPDGSAQGLSARSAMVQSTAMRAAKETLPPKYSDINKSELKATVTADGGTIDFDLDVDPKPPVAETKEASGESKQAKPDAAKPKEPEKSTVPEKKAKAEKSTEK